MPNKTKPVTNLADQRQHIPNQQADQQHDWIMRLPEVKRVSGLGRSTIYALQKSGEFPAAISLGANSVGWLASEVYQWLQDRIDARVAERGAA